MIIRVETDWYQFRYYGDTAKKHLMWRVKLLNESREVMTDFRVIQHKKQAAQEYRRLKKSYPEAREEIIDLINDN